MSPIRRLLSRTRPGSDDGTLPPRPDEPLAVIGDIHGCADLLGRLLDRLDRNHPDARRVFVGDYVDRGPDSRQVLDLLRNKEDAVCLIGNHEEMMLEFIDQPAEGAVRWLRNGGQATLASYGIGLDRHATEAEVLSASRELKAALADGTEDWLRSLPLFWQSGTVVVTHAGPDPARPIAGQPDNVFTWGHNRFLRQARSDGLWVAHGHWIQDRPVFGDSRISVDTGAFATGRLTAAIVAPDGQVSFLIAKA